MTEVDGPGSGISKHCGGSRSVSTLAREMAAKNNLPLEQCIYDSFQAIHTRKDGSWTTSKDASIDARVQKLAAEQWEGADLNQIYQTVLAKKEASKEFRNKNRMYGTGTLALSLLSTGSSCGCATSQFQATQEFQTQFASFQKQWHAQMQAQLQEKRRLREEQVREERRLREEQSKKIEEQAKQLAAIQQMLFKANIPQPPPKD